MSKISKLLEEFEKINEISDELKTKVLDKRRLNTDIANAKLARTSKTMAKHNIGKPDSIDITFIYGDCETNEDDYNQGILNGGTYWDNKQKETITLKLDTTFEETLIEAIKNYLYIYWFTKDSLVFDSYLDSIRFSAMANENNDEPSEQDYENWRNGNKKLWLVDGSIQIDINEVDKPYFIQALKDVNIEVED